MNNGLLPEGLSCKIIDAEREVYKEFVPGYNVEKDIFIIQCISVKIRGKLLQKI